MANGSSRLVAVLVSLILGFALGWFAHKPEAVKPATGDHLIGVHNDGSVTQMEAHISRSANNNHGNHVAWVADGGQSLVIAFPEKGFPTGVKEPPFVGMKSQPGVGGDTDWIVRCGGDTCFSGDVNPKLPEGVLRYKYDQIVAGTRVDGWIIIDK